MSILKESFWFHGIHNLPPSEPDPHAHQFCAVFRIEVEATDTVRVRHELLRARIGPLCHALQTARLINDLDAELGDGSMEAIAGWLLRSAPALLAGVPASVASVELRMAETDDSGRPPLWHGIERP